MKAAQRAAFIFLRPADDKRGNQKERKADEKNKALLTHGVGAYFTRHISIDFAAILRYIFSGGDTDEKA